MVVGLVVAYCLLTEGGTVEQICSLVVTLVISVVMVLFGLRTPGHKTTILVNPVTKKLSELSMEIYLSHMMVVAVLRKPTLTHLTPWEGLNYALTVTLTLAGAIVFSIILTKLLNLVRRWLCGRKTNA